MGNICCYKPFGTSVNVISPKPGPACDSEPHVLPQQYTHVEPMPQQPIQSYQMTHDNMQYLMTRLEYYTFNNTPASFLTDCTFYARFVDIYDADTLTCIVEVRPNLFQKVTVRVVGIDACEITSKNPLAKELAVRARNRAIQYLTSNDIIISNHTKRSEVRELLQAKTYIINVKFEGVDKYGRNLGIVSKINGETLASVLLNEKLALPYDGGKRLDDAEQVRLLLSQ